MHRCQHPNGSNGSSAYVSAICFPFNKVVRQQIRLYRLLNEVLLSLFPQLFIVVAEIVGVALIRSSIFFAKSGAILPFRVHSLNLQKTRFMCIIFAA